MTTLLRRICALGLVMFWQSSAAVAIDEITLEQVSPGVFLFRGVHEQMSASNQGAIGNSGFIVGRDAVAVIDPGGSLAAGERLRRAIEKVTDLPVDYLVLTHFHPDHVAGAMAFEQTSNVIAHANYARATAQRALFYLERFRDILPGTLDSVFRPPTLTVEVGKAIDIDLGERIISIEAHPLAHTDNDLTVHDRQSNTFWASDLVFAQRTPSLDGSLIGWLAVLSELDERGFGVTVPGHGKPEEWQLITASQKAYLLELRDDVREMISQQIPLSDVLANHDGLSSENAQWHLYAAQHGSNLAKAYSELEWE